MAVLLSSFSNVVLLRFVEPVFAYYLLFFPPSISANNFDPISSISPAPDPHYRLANPSGSTDLALVRHMAEGGAVARPRSL